ncbi:MAG: DEAD/DEAH box helicase, partial [Bacteriovoracaceae bacterium]|nr:DEAD/DEAH box helicase [Bacteriovoracaceae bacterium]
MSFSDFNLLPELNKAIEKLGYTEPTDIQAEALPILLGDDVDFVGQAQTGTGKTAAFVLPLLQKLDPNNKNIQALVLAPTRELANQVCQEVEKLGEFSRVKSYSVFGGICYDRQIRGIRKTKPQIIVGTPGRLIDLMNQGVLNFSQAKYLVLDEADEMLNMGFFDDVQKIVGNFSAERSMWMFSATMPTPIMNLIKKDFTDPKVVKVTKKTLSNADVTQTYYAVRAKDKETALCRLIDINVDMYGIVFCNTKKDTWELTDSLLAKGYKVDSLHGDMGQLQRDRSMARFKAGKSRLMICTDVAARGIDVNNLTHVVNYGLPRDMESFVHRIGRTGRAGLKGNAVSLIDPRERGYLRRLERFTKQQMIEGKLPTINEIKSGILRRELEKTTSLVEAILEKGEDFAIDSIYKEFADHYEVLSKEEFMKVMFSWRFNKEFKLLTEVTTAKATDRDSRGGGRD